MLPKTQLVLIAVALAAPLGASSVRADITSMLNPLELVTSKVTVDPLAQTITFGLTFDRAPDLQTYNAYTNAADEFAIDILNSPGTEPALVGSGGEDLRLLSSQYRVDGSTANYGRVATPLGYSAITTPRYAGSLLLDLIPYSQVGSTVTITASYSRLFETDGVFEATLETYRFGAWSGQTVEIGNAFTNTLPSGGLATGVPEPASLALLGLGSVVLLTRRMGRRVKP